MIAMDRGRKIGLTGLVLAAGLVVGQALAQQDGQQRYQAPANSRGAAGRAGNTNNLPPLTPKMIPVNPSDPIAIVNDQAITRSQLADECVARKGKEILDLLINRTLIEQALRARKMEVTAADIDQDIESVAARFGLSREQWLRTLDKERNISPIQYARDVIYPAIALRRLCAGRVQVTPEELKKAFDAQFGDKVRCRMILLDKQSTAIEIWKQLRENPGAFENLAQKNSMDPSTASLGGLLAQPITRHSTPETLSDAVFHQLVDGDERDKDPSHKPKDGDFTGPIQVGELGWVLMRRESLIAADPKVDLKSESVRRQAYELMYDVKLKEAMNSTFQELMKAAAIENRLTGAVKLANEERDPTYGAAADEGVKLMSGDGGQKRKHGSAPVGVPKTAAVPKTPAALSPEAAKEFENLQRQRPVQPGAGAAGSTATTTPTQTPSGSPN
jgi:parvulin-like peptidyl-prolyl isomerase